MTAVSPRIPTPRSPRPAVGDRPKARLAAASASAAQVVAGEVMHVMPLVMDAMRVAMRSQAGEQLSVPQFRCLSFVGREPGTSIGSVAAFLGVTMPTASAMIDRLVRAGAVSMNTSTRDRRRQELEITPSGRAQLDLIEQGARVEMARALAARSAAELEKVRDGLTVLRAAFGVT